MARWLAHARARLLAEQRGFTLMELLMTTAILSVVVGAILAMLDTTAKLAPQDSERAHVIQESQVGLYRMTREIRQAHDVVSGDADTIVVNVLVNGTATQVTFDCGVAHPSDPAYRQCVRQAGGNSDVLVDRVVNGTSRPVFEYRNNSTSFTAVPATQARYVRATAIVAARGDRNQDNGHKHEIVLDDGAFMRNADA